MQQESLNLTVDEQLTTPRKSTDFMHDNPINYIGQIFPQYTSTLFFSSANHKQERITRKLHEIERIWTPLRSATEIRLVLCMIIQ